MSNDNTGVRGSVAALIEAFTNCVDLLRRLRGRRRRTGKSRRKEDGNGGGSGSELELTRSLRQGPADIQREYSRHYGTHGERMARGDAIAQTSLAETLLRLNTGLIGIIGAFLAKENKDVRLDYRSLTSLSETSRSDTLHTLDRLSQRLSQSSLGLVYPSQLRPDGPPTKPRARAGPPKTKRKTPSKETIARLPVKSSSQTQLAFVRPRPKRATSATSPDSKMGSISSNSNSSSSTMVLPKTASPPSIPESHTGLAPPPPLLPLPTTFYFVSPDQPSGRSAAPRPVAPQPASPRPVARENPNVFRGTPPQPPTPFPPPPPPLSPLAPPPPPPPPAPAIQRRRPDRPTPSAYSFASDSTKLGEIPMRKWHEPFDFEAMERLNAEEMAKWRAVPPGATASARPKRRLFGFLRKGGPAAP